MVICLYKQISNIACMSDQRSPYSDCLLFSANAFARILSRNAEPYFKKVGLSFTQGFLLMSIARESGITAGKLARELVLDPSTITRALEKLELKGLAYREDRAGTVEVFPTPEGNKAEKDVRAAWGKARVFYEARFTKRESQRLAKELEDGLAWMLEWPDR